MSLPMFRVLLLVCAGALLSGCAISEEDKAFYYRGWLNPRELDRDQTPPSRYGGTGPQPPSPRPVYKKDPLID
jgi:hypothetical protein